MTEDDFFAPGVGLVRSSLLSVGSTTSSTASLSLTDSSLLVARIASFPAVAASSPRPGEGRGALAGRGVLALALERAGAELRAGAQR